MVSPTVLNTSRCTHDIPRCTHDISRCTHDIPQCTEHSPMYSMISSQCTEIPQCTAHPGVLHSIMQGDEQEQMHCCVAGITSLTNGPLSSVQALWLRQVLHVASLNAESLYRGECKRSKVVLLRSKNCFKSSIPRVNRSVIRYTFCSALFYYPTQYERYGRHCNKEKGLCHQLYVFC